MAKEKMIALDRSKSADSATMGYHYLFKEGDRAILGEVHSDIIESNNKIKSGNFEDIEETLNSQIHTLNYLMTLMIRKAGDAEYTDQLRLYSDIALKAQNNIRKTVETLVNIKRPSNTTFIKNQATNQQVNFNEDQNKLNNTNELLKGDEGEVINDETLDRGRKAEAVKAHS